MATHSYSQLPTNEDSDSDSDNSDMDVSSTNLIHVATEDNTIGEPQSENDEVTPTVVQAAPAATIIEETPNDRVGTGQRESTTRPPSRNRPNGERPTCCSLCEEAYDINRVKRFNMNCSRHGCNSAICTTCASNISLNGWIREVNPVPFGTFACPFCVRISNISPSYIVNFLSDMSLLEFHRWLRTENFRTLTRRAKGRLAEIWRQRRQIDPERYPEQNHRNVVQNRNAPRTEPTRPTDNQSGGSEEGRNEPTQPTDNQSGGSEEGGERSEGNVNTPVEGTAAGLNQIAARLEAVHQRQIVTHAQLQERERLINRAEREISTRAPPPEPRRASIGATNGGELPRPDGTNGVGPEGEIDYKATSCGTIYTRYNWYSVVAGDKSQYVALAIFMWLYLVNISGESYLSAIQFFYEGAADAVRNETGHYGNRLHNIICMFIFWMHCVLASWMYNSYTATRRSFVGELSYGTCDLYGKPTEINFLGINIKMFENPNPGKYSGCRTVDGLYLNAIRNVYSSIRAGSVAHNNLARFANADLSRLVGEGANAINLANSALYLEQWIEVGNCIFRTGDDKIPNMRY